MSNPVKSSSAPFPLPNAPVVDPTTGLITPAYYLTLQDLYTRSGGPSGLNLTGVQNLAIQASALATSASGQATTATNTADVALTTADNAEATAAAASSAANSAQAAANTIASAALRKANNLGDVATVAIARANLGVAQFPVTVTFDTLPSGLVRSIPLTQAVTVPASFTGVVTWATILPTVDAVFTVQYVRGGVIYVIGQITLVHGGNYILVSTQQAVLLQVGDILQFVCPDPPDATLAQVGLTLPLKIT